MGRKRRNPAEGQWRGVPSPEELALSERWKAAREVVLQFADLQLDEIHPSLPKMSLAQLDGPQEGDATKHRDAFASPFSLGGLLIEIILKHYYKNPEGERQAQLMQLYLDHWFYPALEILQRTDSQFIPDSSIQDGGTASEFRDQAVRILEEGRIAAEASRDKFRTTFRPGKRGNVEPAAAFAFFGDLVVRTVLIDAQLISSPIPRAIRRAIGGTVNRFVIRNREVFELVGPDDRALKSLEVKKARLRTEFFEGKRTELLQFCQDHQYLRMLWLNRHWEDWLILKQTNRFRT